MELSHMAFQFSHDSSHGLPSLQAIEGSDHHLLIAEHTIAVFHHKDPENIPWGLTGTHYVIEATGVFTSLSAASRHLSGSQGKRSQGPERVIVGAPSSDVPLYVMGANHEFYRQDALVLSAGSPSIHCLAPLAKLLDDAFGIEEGLGTTIHAASATGTHFQSPHADSGSQSSIDCIIPRPSRGVENLMRQVIPSVAGRIRTMTLRVPTSDVSILDLTLRLKGSPSYAMVMDRIKNASSHSLQGIVGVSEGEKMSSDFRGCELSGIVDVSAGVQLDGGLIKIICWYDAEWAYCHRLLDLLLFIHGLFFLF